MSNNPYIGARVGFDTERAVTAPFSGASQTVGDPLQYAAVMAIFDNMSDVSVALYVNGILWKTFEAEEAMVLDLRANSGNAPTFAIDANTQFSIIATAGTGSFRISIIYAR